MSRQRGAEGADNKYATVAHLGFAGRYQAVGVSQEGDTKEARRGVASCWREAAVNDSRGPTASDAGSAGYQVADPRHMHQRGP